MLVLGLLNVLAGIGGLGMGAYHLAMSLRGGNRRERNDYLAMGLGYGVLGIANAMSAWGMWGMVWNR